MPKHYLLEEPDPQKRKPAGEPALIQRWCIIRSYGADPLNPHLIIEVAEAAPALQVTLAALPGSETKSLAEQLAGLEQDNLDWWVESSERIQESQTDFLKRLTEPEKFFKGMPPGSWSIEEGMVFLHLNDEGGTLVPFTYQARQMSKDLYRDLTGQKTNAGSTSAKG